MMIEVILCGKCKFCQSIISQRTGGEVQYCNLRQEPVSLRDYCSRAERRDEPKE